MYGREDLHRLFVGIYVGDLLVHVEQVAVTLFDDILAQTLDRGSPAQHLADLLVQGHLRNEVGRTLAVLSLFSGILGSLHNAFSCSSVSFTERRNLKW